MKSSFTFQVASFLIAKNEGKTKEEAMKAAQERYPDLYAKYLMHGKGGEPASVTAPNERPFEQIVAEQFCGCGSIQEAITFAIDEAPAAYERYRTRLRSGEKISFTLPAAVSSDRPFEQIVADNYRVCNSARESIARAIDQAPEAYGKYRERLRNGEKIGFNLSR